MDSYKQLTLEQRYGIYSLFKTGHNQTKIAAVIGVYKSTICRELRRNHGERGYRYKQAHHMAVNRRKDKVPLSIDGNTWAMIESLICEDWSPE
ncbi:MAG: helix-turn-helix domain-containing protein, partial [Candidatus Marinimicrobia bacterium]|nr:helix-turn-helix domain-containing protein [Candidatus Neomarinimicrobiota bacterium]